MVCRHHARLHLPFHGLNYGKSLSGDYVAAMEDVLDVYEEPYDPQHPVVCFDETPRQWIGEVREPQPMPPGQPVREDTE